MKKHLAALAILLYVCVQGASEEREPPIRPSPATRSTSGGIRVSQPLSVFETPQQQEEARRQLPDYIENGLERAARQRQAELAALRTPQQWRLRQQQTRHRLMPTAFRCPPKWFPKPPSLE